MKQKKTIIIFGACGNVGKYMVDYFLERLGNEYELIGTDIIHDEYVESRIRVFQVDINDKNIYMLI